MKWLCIVSVIFLISCGSDPDPNYAPVVHAHPHESSQVYPQLASRTQRTAPVLSRGALIRQINLRRDLIPRGTHARKFYRPMTPRYITIHSTQNFAMGADALRHSLALKRGKLRSKKSPGGNRIGYLAWHFTVDQTRAVQHIPTNEQGEHADYNGPGNNYSIGIEMCENKDNNLTATIERSAILTAKLMHDHNIPLRNVVPHYHWPRWDKSPAHKNCPHFLLDDGRPGRKWRWFRAKVKRYHAQLAVQ